MIDLSKFSRTPTDRHHDRDLIRQRVRGLKIKKFLDVGCSTGSFTEQVAAELGNEVKVFGIEVRADACRSAREKGIRVARHDLNVVPYPFEDESFDLIVSRQNIEHVYLTDRYLEEIRRMLKPGGTCVLTTVNLAGLHYRAMLLFGLLPPCLHPSEHKVFPTRGRNPVYGHKSVFTHSSLREVLLIHGFEIVDDLTHSIYFVPRPVERLLRVIFRNLGYFALFVLRK